MSTNTMSKTTETPAKKSLLSKEWLIEQKSLIALIFLIVVVSFLNPNFLQSTTSSTSYAKHRLTPSSR